MAGYRNRQGGEHEGEVADVEAGGMYVFYLYHEMLDGGAGRAEWDIHHGQIYQYLRPLRARKSC